MKYEGSNDGCDYMKLNRQKKRIYLDLCALERPYDDQSYPRIEAETAAITLIVAEVKAQAYGLTYSPIHKDELEPISDEAMKLEILKLLQLFGEDVAQRWNFEEIERRGFELYQQRFGIADAMHVAYAEACGAEFITCDDDLMRKCRSQNVKIWFGTPVDFGRKEGLL